MLPTSDGGNGYGYNGAATSGRDQLRKARSRSRSRNVAVVHGNNVSRVSPPGLKQEQQQKQQHEHQEQQVLPPPCTDFDMAYFQSYSHLGIHEEMIKDRVRTETYRSAIMQHQTFIQDKVVVDVGCGTGILAIFCAQAGAKRVYAVDASDVAIQAQEVVKANNLSDKVIVLHGRVEISFQISKYLALGIANDAFYYTFFILTLSHENPYQSRYTGGSMLFSCGSVNVRMFDWRLGCATYRTIGHPRAADSRLQTIEDGFEMWDNEVPKIYLESAEFIQDVEIPEEVDVIISEWMGYMLLYESMLASVITARDRWLKPGGLILPSNATLYIAPITHPDRYSENIDFWRDVYGIDMSAMMQLAKQCAFEEPSVETISGENILTWPHVVKHIDCSKVTSQELESVTSRYNFKSMMRGPFHGFAFWFDVEFRAPAFSPSNINAPPPVIGCSNDNDTDASNTPRKKRAKASDTIVLSTAPEDFPTHWQQTIVYFYDPIEVEQDQVIEGSVTLSQSRENTRFMNIHLEYTSGGRSFVKESVLR